MKSSFLFLLFTNFSLISLSLSAYTVYKQNALIFFDPVTENICSEINYWTPFNPTSTCYRFVNMETSDTSDKSTLRIMLDHNEAMSTFADISTSLETIKKKWVRAKNYEISIVDEDEIFKILQFSSKPTSSTTEVSAPYRAGAYYMNSFWVIDGQNKDQYAYWTKTSYDTSNAYAISNTCTNKLYPKTRSLGVRPILTIAKSLLKHDSGVINIDDAFNMGTKYAIPFENKSYGGKIYKQLQGFTLTKDKIVFHASNAGNPENGVLYSYYSKDYKTLYKAEYSTTGHGNDLTYNSKKNTVLICGPNSYKTLYEYNADTMKKTTEITASFSALGYDSTKDMYVGLSGIRMALFDSATYTRKYAFDYLSFETSQGGEAHDGYWFYTTSDLGVGTYQTKSFFGEGKNIVHVYNIKFDSTGKPSKDFGRLICRLIMSGKGELESISFQGTDVIFGFATQKIDKTYTYTFYKINYNTFRDFVKTKAKNQGSNYFL